MVGGVTMVGGATVAGMVGVIENHLMFLASLLLVLLSFFIETC
jgi:F0F1-type ATP synthase epsilon subunit